MHYWRRLNVVYKLAVPVTTITDCPKYVLYIRNRGRVFVGGFQFLNSFVWIILM
jgi:hypothetical protein